MRAIILAFSFIRVPKLFISLLFWPMVIGVGLAVSQAIFSSAYFGLVTESPEQFERRIQKTDEHAWLRKLLYGTEKTLPPIEVCVWQQTSSGEHPPYPGCAVQLGDVALRVSDQNDPATHNVSDVEQLFTGSTRRLHVCRECLADIVIEGDGKERTSKVYGLRALGVFALTDATMSNRIGNHYVAARTDMEHIRDIAGTILLQPEGSEHPINISQATKTMLLILNTAAITIIALWLSLKGHRKVLEYFARNGALLPLVAACGKNTFYAALWIITLLRVGMFLLAALPATIIVYANTIPEETLKIFIGEPGEFFLWISGIVASLGCLAIIASIAELKQRHSMVSFLYRYIPLALCIFGTGVWFVALFHGGGTAQVVQNLIAAVPIIGISPILISPLFTVNTNVIAIHCALAAIIVLVMMRQNSQWFAAHLEEI